MRAKRVKNSDGILANFRYRRKWKRATSILSIFVVIGTIGSLMLPAITMNQYICGFEEHTHGLDCFSVTIERVLSCNVDSLGIHRHTSDCYDGEGNLICSQADFVVHTHDSACFNGEGVLVCTLKEVTEHSHDDSCYQATEVVTDEGHTHGDACYEWVTSEPPTCGTEESSGHSHGEGCYATGEELICTEKERSGHSHCEVCYETVDVLSCELEEVSGHSHGDGCYDENGELICGQEESVGHSHGAECHTQTQNVICGMMEDSGHTHGLECYAQAGSLLCTIPESTGHQHTEECFGLVRGELFCTEEEREPVVEPGEPALICEKPRVVLHTHKGTCYWENELICEKTEILSHQHTDACFSDREVKTLTCTIPEHTHTEECKPTTGLSEEEQAQVDTVVRAIDTLPTIEEVNAQLTAFEEAADEAGRETYLSALTEQVIPVFAQYDPLTEDQKAAVTNAADLMALKWLLPEEEPPVLTEEEQAQLDAVIAQIEALPEAEALRAELAAFEEERNLTDWTAAVEDAREKTQVARNLYVNLPEPLQASVANIQKLADLETLLNGVTAPILTEEEKVTVDALIALIDSLPTLEELAAQPATLEKTEGPTPIQELIAQVDAARKAYNDLNSVQQAAVTNEPKLAALEAQLAAQNTGPSVAELIEAQAIYNEIETLPTVETIQAEFDALSAQPEELAAYQAKLVSQVKGLMARYEPLHEEAIATVTNIQTLLDLITWLEKIGLIEPAPDYTASSGPISAAVWVEGAELPEGAQFVLNADAYSQEEMDALIKQLNTHLFQMEKGVLNYVLLDMHFADEAGTELPFAGSAEVTLTFADPILPGAKDTQVFHFAGETIENVGQNIVQTEAGITSVTLKTNGFSPVVIAGTGHIVEKLDGDYAYIYDARMKADENTTSGEAISTGTASWDSDDNAGNDSTDKNSILRTFDVATYTLSYKTGLRKEATDQGINGYRTGTVYFEFILPLSEQQGQFEPGSMGWLATYTDVKYEIVKEANRQILRGSFLAEPSADNPATIGNSISEMNVAIRVLRMKQGDTVQPTFTLWLEGNKVDTGVVDGIPTKVVTGTTGTCGTHNEQEFETVTPAKITISAAPRFNVALKKGNTGQTSYVESFDFSTGNGLALDKINETMEGRMAGYGLTLQLAGKDKTSGLKGVEIPDQGSTITFDITLSSTYTKEGGSVVDLGNTEYRPRVWSAAPNMRTVAQQDGRAVSAVDYMAAGAPYNSKPDENNNPNNVNQKFLDYCHNGGNWSFVQDASNPNLIHITVTNFSIDLSSLQNFPAAAAAHNGEPNSCQYYNPSDANLKNAWDIQFACFSAAEFWTFQPLVAKVNGTSKEIQTTYGNGSIEFKIQDSNLKVNNTEAAQAVTTDDQLADGIGLTQTGSKQVQIHYVEPNKGYGSPLSTDCWENGYDWATPGQEIGIYQLMVNDNATGDDRGAAFEMLIKWDDAFFEPTGEYWTECSTPITNDLWWSGEKPTIEVLWVAKSASNNGWTHNDLTPDQSSGNTDGNNYDWNMIQAYPDQLSYYATLDALKAAGKVPIGLLVQYRGIVGPGQNHMEVTVQGKVKEDCPTGYVYMTTQYAAMWRVSDLKVAARDDFYARGGTNAEWTARREELIDNYARNIMPLRSSNSKLLEYMANLDKNATAGWVRGYSDRVSPYAKTVSLGNDFEIMRKTWYKNGQTGGTFNKYLLDSCLVPEHVTSIKKNTAQTSTQNGVTENKQTYSLDINQRVVDYALTPSITRTLGDGTAAADSKTTITIIDTLPNELKYISGSAYWGGTYTQDPHCMNPGTVTGGQKLDPVVVENADGTTTLTWTLENVSLATHGTVELEPIYFSARLTGDFVDQQGIDNTVTIRSTGDDKRPLTQANNNEAIYGITIQMSRTVSLVKLADQDKVEIDVPHGFTMYVGNNSSNDTKNQIIVDDLPYNGDQGGTSVHGDINVTEFTVNDIGLVNVTWFYTTDTQFRGKTSTYYMSDTVAGKSNDQSDYFTEARGWYAMTFDASGKCSNLPVNTVQVVGVGTVPAGKTIQMHTTIELPECQGGDVIYNNLMMDTLNSRASSRVVSRSLSGLTWIDRDHDGLQDENEMPFQSGVKVTLMKLDEDGIYQDVATMETGQQCDVIRGAVISSYEEGKYLFYNLLPGTYAVRFEKGTFDITYFHASPVDTGDNLDQYDQIDSDGIPELGINQELLKTEIQGVHMPTIEAMGQSNTYHSPYHDSGFYAWGAVLPETGGAGTLPYTFSGWAIILTACALMYNSKRKNRKGAR